MVTTEELIEQLRRSRHLFGSSIGGMLTDAANRLEHCEDSTRIYNSLCEFRKSLPDDDSWKNYKRGMDAAIRLVELGVGKRPPAFTSCAKCRHADVLRDNGGCFLLFTCRKTGWDFMDENSLLFGCCAWGEPEDRAREESL